MQIGYRKLLSICVHLPLWYERSQLIEWECRFPWHFISIISKWEKSQPRPSRITECASTNRDFMSNSLSILSHSRHEKLRWNETFGSFFNLIMQFTQLFTNVVSLILLCVFLCVVGSYIILFLYSLRPFFSKIEVEKLFRSVFCAVFCPTPFIHPVFPRTLAQYYFNVSTLIVSSCRKQQRIIFTLKMRIWECMCFAIFIVLQNKNHYVMFFGDSSRGCWCFVNFCSFWGLWIEFRDLLFACTENHVKMLKVKTMYLIFCSNLVKYCLLIVKAGLNDIKTMFGTIFDNKIL